MHHDNRELLYSIHVTGMMSHEEESCENYDPTIIR